MKKKHDQTAFDDRQAIWFPFVASIFGKTEDKIRVSQVVEAIESVAGARGPANDVVDADIDSQQNRQSWLYKTIGPNPTRVPSADNAWLLGQAVSHFLPWANGLLFLYAAGYLAEFVGALGSLDQETLLENAVEVSGLVQTAFPATYSGDGNIHFDPDLMERFEAERLKDRLIAREVWSTLASGNNLSVALEKAWHSWRNRPDDERFDRFLGLAESIAKDRKFTLLERVQLLNRTLTSWLHDVTSAERNDLYIYALPDEWLALIKLHPREGAIEASRKLLMQCLVDDNLQSTGWWPASLGPADGLRNFPPGTTLKFIIANALKTP